MISSRLGIYGRREIRDFSSSFLSKDQRPPRPSCNTCLILFHPFLLLFRAKNYIGWNNSEYIFPGIRANSQMTAAERRAPVPREITGSSVATALAAGSAATIIYCFKASVLATKFARSRKGPQDSLPSIRLTEKHVQDISEHAAMKTAFSRIGVVNDAEFIQVWDLFVPVSQVLDDPNKSPEDKVESIVKLCSGLMDWKLELRGT